MQVECSATVEDALQRENLCACIQILGGIPSVAGNTVRTDYVGDPAFADKFIKLFENYIDHDVRVTGPEKK